MSYHRGSVIIVSSPPRGLFREGWIKISESLQPGVIVQIDGSEGVQTAGNNFIYELYNADADGGRPKGPLFIVLPDMGINTWDLNTTAYAATTTEYIYSAYATPAASLSGHVRVYTPQAGEEFNLLLGDPSGSATMAAGTMLIIDDTTGRLVATTGTPECEPFMLLATTVPPSGGPGLAHVIYTGY